MRHPQATNEALEEVSAGRSPIEQGDLEMRAPSGEHQARHSPTRTQVKNKPGRPQGGQESFTVQKSHGGLFAERPKPAALVQRGQKPLITKIGIKRWSSHRSPSPTEKHWCTA
jgi:hypothetical protein